MSEVSSRIQQGSHHDPFEWLGIHASDDGHVVRAFMPSAEHVELDGIGPLQRTAGTDTFSIVVDDRQLGRLPAHYRLNWTEKGSGTQQSCISPYSFAPQLSNYDLDLFAAGKHLHVWRILGAHLTRIDEIEGCLFALWAPNVKRVSVIGDFNGWHGLRHPMRNRGSSGVWELFIPGLAPGDRYKFEIRTSQDEILHKSDP